METRNVSGDMLSNEVFEEKEELVQAFDEALEDKEVALIKVTKDIPAMTDIRRNTVERQVRKLNRKLQVLNDELKTG